MKRFLLLLLCICSLQNIYSQEEDADGVVSLNIPARNSLTFNRFNINPTFSFVREQSKTISFNNKREWVQFENAPLTYFGSYSGRFAENIGAGIGVFKQNYGVLTTFGGMLNFAYNARVGSVNNLTFGLNVGAYKSGINTADVVTNFDDPSLQNVPEHTLLTINPGINFGLEYLDFGLSINNMVMYNFKTSSVVDVNPEQSLVGHIMYTGYMDSKGFFDESKFTGLLKSEIYEDKTIISALAMITVPKGFWFQGGYNSVYGASAGVGLNITKNIALEYNFENAIGKLNVLGNSHDFTIAYRFENNNYYDYSPQDELTGILENDNKRRKILKAKSEEAKAKKAEEKKKALAAREEAEAKAKVIAEQKAKEEAEAKAKLIAEQKAKEEAEAKAKLNAEQKAKEEAEAKAKLIAEQKAKEEAEAKAKLIAEQKAKEEAEAKAQLIAEQKAKEEAEAKAKLIAEQKAKEEAEAKAILIAEQKAKEETEAKAKLIAEQKAKEEAEAKAKLIAEQKAKEEAEAIAESQIDENLTVEATDELAKSMKNIANSTENSKESQNELLKRFNEIVDIKNEDLKSLKEENDLGDQGITVEPRPFKSVTAENNELSAVMKDLEKVINSRNDKIDELKELYNERSEIDEYALDEVNLFYKNEIDKLKSEQQKAIDAKIELDARLETIRIATEFEKRRRIKRAAFNSEEDRYNQDRSLLQNIKKTTSLNETAYTAEDFDSGEDLGNSIVILKNIKNVESGYYIIIAVHSDVTRRNDFVTKVVSAGRTDIDFFHDVSTSKYYIFYEKFNNIQDANNALKNKGNRPYNNKMSIVKIEN
ncbi:PorP/SprF family type IX secretion system membrane protein [Winogradskyella litoriviva]|uniref:PorP/SprF family type IX secretion system membrane protein n=1 Tax=Winogradskyella litoriviva TaxID=1220182 RepID=A0ABX2E5I9_9FLAO|nr:PorP/SprF family type IX secretion system membrane protein [Winogradskyella litoriviva]NRD23690.1 PorP/SprF family type IX secretion system membrane protein [Winogradskyella litoriviva]